METVSTTSRLTDGVPISALERGLDALAHQVRADTDPPQFFRDLLRLLVHTVRADQAAVWMRTGETTWNRIALDVTATDGATTSQTALPGSEWLTTATNADAPKLARFVDGDGEHQRITSVIRQGGVAVGVLEAVFDSDSLPASTNTLLPYCGALAELAGDFLVQHELRFLRRERAEWKQWEQWLTTLLSAENLTRLADLIANDGRALTSSDRVSVLRMRTGRPRIVSVSGVDVIDPRSSSVQAQERLVEALVPVAADAWFGLDAPIPAEHQSAWERLRHVASTVAAGVLWLRGPDQSLQGALICERFQPVSDAAAWRTRCESLQRWTTASWSAAAAHSASPWERLWNSSHREHSRLGRAVRRWTVLTTICAGVIAALAIVPAPLVITGEGKLLPAVRRDIFASTTGIVEDVRVQHGDAVKAGDPLIVLRDPNTELEATRVSGELATVRTRLSVVQAARISSGGTGGDPTLRAQQLTGEEEELRQRLESLTRQQSLLEAERKLWTLTSPIDGQVLTWDVEPLLAGRPVQRGHVLLEVGATAGDWVVETMLSERDAGAVLAAWNQGQQAVPVEFVPITGQRWTGHGTVRDVAQVTDVNERGESSVRVVIAFDRAQAPELRSGKTVLPRIACGTYAVGYVWFRDLIDTLQRAWWQWW